MSDRANELTARLEKLLVLQFRKLQELIVVTREERDVLSAGGADAIMELVECKESILDQLSLMEDTRRMYVQDLAGALKVPNEALSLPGLLPYFSADAADRIGRLNDGIVSLVAQARDLNYGNRALATSMFDWLHSAQSFLLSCAQTQLDYRPAGATPNLDQPRVLGLDQRV